MIHRLDITARLQHRIVEIASTAIPLIAKIRPEADLVGLAHLRGEMIVAISAYARHVRDLEADGQMPREQLDALMLACAKLDTAYGAFRRRWVHRDGIDHWHEYRLSAAVLMKQIRSLVQQGDRVGSPLPCSSNGRHLAGAQSISPMPTAV